MAALITELQKLGFVLKEKEGSILSWDGERCIPEFIPAIDTYEDHRMAMAFALCAIVCGQLLINDEKAVSKSYPNFWENLSLAGFYLKYILV